MSLVDMLTAIADAIRGKTGKTEGMTLEQMAVEIEGIKTGGNDMFTTSATGCIPVVPKGTAISTITLSFDSTAVGAGG